MKKIAHNYKKWLHVVFLIAAIGASIGLLFFVVSCTTIGFSVKEHCADAQAEYGGECVPALAALLEDESKSFAERNSAIWALGQMGDAQALPVLEKYSTGVIPEHGSLEDNLSQLLLTRAIKLIESGVNLTAWAWR